MDTIDQSKTNIKTKPVEPVEPSGHTVTQAGLHGHSHDPENDLMKPFVLEYRAPGYWVALASFATQETADNYKTIQEFLNGTTQYRVREQAV